MTDQSTGNVVANTEFKTAGDWINRIIEGYCVDKNVGAVDEVKDAEGKVVTRARKGKDVLDVDAIKTLAEANGLTVKEYPNTGMYRMNIGNMLRTAARKRHGLNLPDGDVEKATADSQFVFTSAPDDFAVNPVKTHNPDGSKIAPEPVTAAAE